MRTITNDYRDAQILNLGSAGERGPYLVTQTGVAPRDAIPKTRMQAGLLFLATIALLIPSAISQADSAGASAFTHKLSVGLAVLLIVAYGLGMSGFVGSSALMPLGT